MKWKGITPEGIERIRQSNQRHRPWEKSTGPRTPEGKAKVAKNLAAYNERQRLARQADPLQDDLRTAGDLHARLAEQREMLMRAMEGGAAGGSN